MGCANLEGIKLSQYMIIRGAVTKFSDQKRGCNVKSGNFLDKSLLKGRPYSTDAVWTE